MPVLNIYKLDGSQAGTVEVNNEIFGIEPNKNVMHEVLGGGVTHGPKPRSYAKKVNKKVRKLALKSALATKISEGNVIVLDDFTLETPKTKTFINFAKALNFDGLKQLFVVSFDSENFDRDYSVELSTRNIEKVTTISTRELNIYWLIKQDKVVLTKEALATIEEVLA